MPSPDRQISLTISEISRDCMLDPPPVELPAKSIQIWQFPLTISGMPLEAYGDLLSEDERVRASRYRFERDARRFVVARGVVRTILGRRCGIHEKDLRFDYAHYGKPAIANADGEIRFSVSHSGEFGMLAVARGQEVGVDLENMNRKVDTDRLAERYFSPRERAALRGLSNDQRVRGFFRCWTSKEAFLKGQGFGLSRSLDSFDVEVNPARPARLIATRPDAHEAEIWSLHEVPTEPDYAAAVAWEGAMAGIHVVRFR